MEIGGPTWDGILGAAGAVVGGALGAGGAALGVFLQLRAERRKHDVEVASFREGVSRELAARATELVVLRTAIGAALGEKRYPAALDAVVHYAQLTQPSLFRYAGDRLHLLTEAQ